MLMTVLCFILGLLAITDLFKSRVGYGMVFVVAFLAFVPYVKVIAALIFAADVAYILYRKYGK